MKPLAPLKYPARAAYPPPDQDPARGEHAGHE